MTKKILYIILGAIFVFGLLFLLWSWLFSGGGINTQNNGQFGTSTDATQNVGAGGPSTNGEANIGNNATNGTVTLGNSTGQNTGARRITGAVTAIHGSAITMSGPGGTYTVDVSAVTGRASTLGAIAVGDTITIQGGVNGSGTLGGGATQVAGNNTTFTTSSPGVQGVNGTSSMLGISNVQGVTWLGSPFNATGINSLSGGAGGFAPTITSPNGGTGGGTSLIEALAATAIAGSLSCAIQAGLITLTTTGTTAFAAPTAAGIAAAVPPAGLAPFPANPVGYSVLALGSGPLIVADLGQRTISAGLYGQGVVTAARNTGKDTITFEGCIVNVIAKTALQQITISVVNWINSGFNGSPSFVTNYQQFFTNVADAAAGQFIQGSGLSFLCSPFALQIKIAVAQSYANRNNAQSCTLTKVIKDVNGFMNGNFAQGGWPGMLSFTTVPTNNPYGAYAYAQIGLVGAQNTALANAKNNISPTGFLNLQQVYNCDDPKNNGIGGSASIGTNPQAAAAAGSAALPSGCKTKVVTPGGAIADSLGAVNKSGVDQLGLTNDIDQIITALTNQLMVSMLQKGLTSLSQTTTQTPADIAAQSQATTMINDMQSKTTIAEQLGSVYQGSISDIENVQAGLNSLANCWSSVATSTNATSAAQNAAAANATLQSLESQVASYNNYITQVNSAIAALNQFELQVSSAASAADVTTLAANYNAAVSAGTFPSQTDLTTAQQDRTSLQSQLAATSASTQSGLAQCQAAAQGQ